MYRCITNLKALVIDMDSFNDFDVDRLSVLFTRYSCLFIVSEYELQNKIENRFENCVCYRVEKFIKPFLPNASSHSDALRMLNVNATEVAYVSSDINFINNAIDFFGGTIWITGSANYEQASKSPDLVCGNIDIMIDFLNRGYKGSYGESVVCPGTESKGIIMPVKFYIDNEVVPIYMIGRYFGHSHYMNQLHPYSAAISLNKKIGKPYYRIFDDIFTQLYIRAVIHIQERQQVYGIVSVPVRPNNPDRFDKIRRMVSTCCNIEDLGHHFVCVNDYPSQRSLSSLERQSNIENAFLYNGDLRGKSVVLIDDVVTTGATISECIRELNRRGADNISVVALAINQMHGSYWSTNQPSVSCPCCGRNMNLLVNSHSKDFFYSCYNCGTTIDFDSGMNMLYDRINVEFNTY